MLSFCVEHKSECEYINIGIACVSFLKVVNITKVYVDLFFAIL